MPGIDCPSRTCPGLTVSADMTQSGVRETRVHELGTAAAQKPPIELEVVRELPVDVATAYAWLTDYQPEDGALFGKGVTRTAVRVDPNHVRLCMTARAFGMTYQTEGAVTLDPPNHWQFDAEMRSSRRKMGDEFCDYRLVPTGSGRSKLAVKFGFDVPGRFARWFLRRRGQAFVEKNYDRIVQALVSGTDPTTSRPTGPEVDGR